MAAVDWKSVGRAWTPESEGFAVERIESSGRQTRSRGGGEMKSGRRRAKERLNLIPIVVSRRRWLLGESGKRVRKVEGGIEEGSREDKHRGRRRTREGERDSVRIVFLHVFP